jgi:hypothetical protein
MYELMAETRPMHVLELPQKPDDADAMAHWVRELRKLRARLEAAFGVTITMRDPGGPDDEPRRVARQLAALMQAVGPAHRPVAPSRATSPASGHSPVHPGAGNIRRNPPAVQFEVRVLMTGTGGTRR